MTPRVQPTGVPRGPFPVGFMQSMTWITCTVPRLCAHHSLAHSAGMSQSSSKATCTVASISQLQHCRDALSGQGQLVPRLSRSSSARAARTGTRQCLGTPRYLGTKQCLALGGSTQPHHDHLPPGHPPSLRACLQQPWGTDPITAPGAAAPLGPGEFGPWGWQ